MSEAPITATVDISDAVSPRLRAAVAKLSDRTGLHKAMAFRVEDRVIENLQAKDQTPNKLGGLPDAFLAQCLPDNGGHRR